MTTNQLIDKMIKEGGALVLSDECSVMEITDAQATGRFSVNEEGLGFILRPKEWLTKSAEAMVDRKRVNHYCKGYKVEYMGVKRKQP